jgi:hypothetical protein
MATLESRPVTFLKAVWLFLLAGFIFLSLIYISYFSIIAKKAELYRGKECEIEIFAGATVPSDAEIPTESCSEQFWKKNIFWAIFALFLSAFYWIPFILGGAVLWRNVNNRYFLQRPTLGLLMILLSSLIPSLITSWILFFRFSFNYL